MKITQKPVRLVAGMLLAAAAVITSSCGRERGGPAFCRVSGRLFCDGQPAKNALVVLHPISQNGRCGGCPVGNVDHDGVFVPRTIVGDYVYEGLAPGEYKVAITWPEKASDYSSDKLKGRYADPNKSGIRLTVSDGRPKLRDIDLTLE